MNARRAPHPGTRLTVLSLCLMVGTTPLIVFPEVYDSALLPKWLAFHACLALACLGWILRFRRGQVVSLASFPFLVPGLCLFGVALLSAPATPRPLEALVELLNLAALLILCAVAWQTPAALRPVLWTTAAVGLVVSVIGILQYHGLAFLDIPSAAPPSATFLNRNPAAEYLICALPLSVLLFFLEGGPWKTPVSGLSASLMAVYLGYTRTRAAWAGLVCAGMAAVVVLGLQPEWRRSLYRGIRSGWDSRKRAWGVGCLLLFALLFALPADQTTLRQRGLPHLEGQKTSLRSTITSVFQPAGAKDLSATERLAFWSNSLRMVADRPFLGVGPGGWSHAYPPYDRGAALRRDSQPRNPHNDYLWIAVEYGLLGLGAYLWFLAVGFRGLRRMAGRDDPSSRMTGVAFGLSLLALAVAALFGFPREQAQTALFPFLVFGLAAGITGGSESVPERKGDIRSRPSGRLVIPCLFLVLSLVAVEVDRRRLEFDAHYLGAMEFMSPPPNWPGVLSEVARALDYGPFRPHLYYLMGVALEDLGREDEAGKAYRDALLRSPNAWYVCERLALIEARQGRLEDALSHARKAVAILDDAESRLALGFVLNSMGDRDGAVREWSRAVRLAPDFVEAHSNLGAALFAGGDLEGAIAHYRQALQVRPDYAEVRYNLGVALRARGDLDGALDQYRQAIRYNPGYLKAHLNLGSALAEKGSRAEAIETFRACLPLSPDESTRVRVQAAIRDLGGTP